MRLLVAFALLTAGPLASSSVCQTFLKGQYPVGNKPRSVASADLNGDGRADLAVANQVSFSVTVLLGLGGGEFENTSSFFTGYPCISCALADLNGDGKPDFVAANSYQFFSDTAPGSVSVLLGDGAGGFPSTSVFMNGSLNSVDLAVADFNGDGKLDVATANHASFGLSVLLGDGLGGFGIPMTQSVPPQPAGIDAGDLNGDGRVDLTLTAPNLLIALLGDGAGGFASPAHPWPVPDPNLRDLALGDVNGDGVLDAVIAMPSFSKSMAVALGNGGGGFSPAALLSINGYGQSVAIADLDLDGKADFAVAVAGDGSVLYPPNRISVLGGDGAGGLSGSGVDVSVGFSPIFVLARDLNGDSKPDLVSANFNSNTISVVLANAAGGYVVPSSVQGLTSPSYSAIGDLNGDGIADLAVSQYGAPAIAVLLGQGAGGFAAVSGAAASSSIRFLTLADVNGDGRLDLAGSSGLNDIAILLGNGAGGFGSPTLISESPGQPSQFAIGDVNGDGKPDLVALQSNYVSLHLGDGAGGFGPSVLMQVPVAVWIALGDLNADGWPEIVVASGSGPGSINVLKGAGGGAFVPAVSYAAGGSGRVALTDIDGDGRIDAVVSRHDLTISGIGVLLGDGVGGLGSASAFGFGPGSTNLSPSSMALGDFDGDGRTDVVGALTDAAAMCLWKGDGAGGFKFESLYSAGAGPVSISAGDLDADGLADVVATNLGPGQISLLWNLTAIPGNLAPFGSGSPGCAGRLGVGVTEMPKVGSPNFGLRCTNAPRNALGLGIVGDVADLAGSDPFFLGIDLHVDFAHSSFLLGLNFFSDGGGSGTAHFPIPNDVTLAGKLFVAQSLWIESVTNALACSGALLHLVSSPGLAFVVLP